MKRMLFNATQQEEIRVAIVDGQKLIDLDIETSGKEQRKGNIYKGVITRIEPSLEAAFVDYSADRHGFLSFKEISRQYFAEGVDASRARIQDALREGQEIIVQVDKDERGTKGAALTTYVSLAGRYVVLMPNNPRGGGVSRRVEGEERNELRDAISQLEVPNGMSIIARTAGIGRSVEELNRDLSYLMRLWKAIENASKSQSGAFLIYQEGSLVIRAIRDYFQHDIGELLIDNESIFEQARQFMGHVMPENVNRVKLYSDDVPLFSRFQIEHQIETAYARQVPLPSGGAVVIDHTEALVSIDVNSARATKGHDIEATALNTNLEAADEIARQLRLRDLGGLVVIDFIDMESAKNQREVENRLRDALHYDRARVQIGKISRFGLMELSRQRLQTSLGETSHIPCPRCHGIGHIRGIESSALHVLRILQEEAMKENTAAVHAQVPIEVATYLLNEKRAEFHSMEARLKVSVVLIPNMHLETPNYTVTRLRHDELNQTGPLPASYQMVEVPTEAEEQVPGVPGEKPQRPEAAVKGVTPEQPIAPRAAEPPPPAPKEPSILQKIFGWLTRKPEEAAPEVKAPPRNREPRRGGRDGERRDRRPQDGRGRGGEGRGEGEGSRRRGRGGDRDRNQPQQQQGGAPAGEREEAAARSPQQQGEGRKRQQKQRGEGHEGREPREPREAREPREPREPRQNRDAPRDGERDSAPQQQGRLTERPAGADAAPTEGGSGEGRGRRRRGRRDRQRGEGVEADRNNEVSAVTAPLVASEALPAQVVEEATVSEPAAPAVAVAMPSFMLPPVERKAPAPVMEAEPVVEVESEPEEAAIEVSAAPAAPSAPRGIVEMFSERIADPVNPPAVGPLTVPVPPAPPAMEPIQLPEGMVMIETRSDRAAPAVEEAAPEAPRRPRPRLQQVVAEEPMQQVETRK